jgi:hypothetical protein
MTALKLIEQQAITLDELWIQYWANGGNARPFEPETFLHCAYELCPFDHTIIAGALKDRKAA